MKLEIFVLLAICCVPTLSIHCEEDTSFDPNLKDKDHTVTVDHIGDLNYWRTSQNNFQVFGKFDGDISSSIIKGNFLSLRVDIFSFLNHKL